MYYIPIYVCIYINRCYDRCTGSVLNHYKAGVVFKALENKLERYTKVWTLRTF